MRKRLSYANVMATLAFFFALTGGTMAATKYLQANDPITQGDLAGSTYSNPTIAPVKVTTGKIANGAITSAKFDASALAPDSDKLDGKDSSTFASIVGSGSGSFATPTLGTGQCIGESAGSAPAGSDLSTDYVLLFVQTSQATVNGYLIPPDIGSGPNEVIFTACNGAPSSRVVAGAYRYLIVR